ncbi:MAG: SUMF1/EgtB/PvdO family nonheme iron enzyme [Anaerolineales bacterium]|nr:SUMF1/EgtB/PvdO family nonheme iron enzyme [Anaerolineales bacterium]
MNDKVLVILSCIIILFAAACGSSVDSDETISTTKQAETQSANGGEEQTVQVESPKEPLGKDIQIRPSDNMEMVRIPVGEFIMGDDASAFAPQKPAHTVYLDEYWIDRFEVSNEQYRRCFDAGICQEPTAWQDENFNAPEQPAIVTWDQAKTFCEWTGGRMATEAEWEKAARGTDGRAWTWGDEFVSNRANLSDDEDGYGFTAPVGSFPGDSSPYGVMDTAGNAAEWVADWWSTDYYQKSPAKNPTGPASGDQKVVRSTIAHAGGGPEKCRCTARYAANPNWTYGIRCVFTTEPGD